MRLILTDSQLASIIAHRESIVNLQMVAMITDQRRISQAAKRDGNALKRLSMMGAIFLPGTFLASIFSMVFFRLPDCKSNLHLLIPAVVSNCSSSNWIVSKAASESSGRLSVAPQLWIYFAIAIPLTVFAVGTLWMWGRKRSRKSKKLTAALEDGLEDMEREIAMQMKRQKLGVKHAVAPVKSDLDDF